jgi:N12 class adenine-specific DNA methylase
MAIFFLRDNEGSLTQVLNEFEWQISRDVRRVTRVFLNFSHVKAKCNMFECFTAQHIIYRVSHVTPDPRAGV